MQHQFCCPTKYEASKRRGEEVELLYQFCCPTKCEASKRESGFGKGVRRVLLSLQIRGQLEGTVQTVACQGEEGSSLV